MIIDGITYSVDSLIIIFTATVLPDPVAQSIATRLRKMVVGRSTTSPVARFIPISILFQIITRDFRTLVNQDSPFLYLLQILV